MSIVLTRMQNFRAASNLDAWEVRASQYGGLNVFARQTEGIQSIITPELQARAQEAMGNTLETPVLDFENVTIGSTRPVTISDAESTSAMQSITFATYQFGFTMIPSQYTNNEIAYQRDFNHKLELRLNKLLATLDTATITALNAAKTQVVGNLLGKYTFGVTDTVNALNSQRLRIMADINPLMASNDFYQPRHIIGEAGLLSEFLELQEQGLYNDQNRAIQWADKELHFTNRITNAANKVATGFVVNEGSVGIVSRVDRDSLLRHTTSSGYDWNVVSVPGLPFPVGMMYYETAADKSALHAGTADMTATKVEAYSWSVDVAMVTAYNSAVATLAAPILKFDIDSDDTL
jgi:hypothetical protein